jgi:drug/metabolite transporter superfamily protein YnfA
MAARQGNLSCVALARLVVHASAVTAHQLELSEHGRTCACYGPAYPEPALMWALLGEAGGYQERLA